MTFLKPGRMPFMAGLLCVLLVGFAGISYGQVSAGVRWDVSQSPTEVINTGRSEVTGSITLFVHDTATTGTALGGSTQIAFVYDQPSMQIDNTTTTGIKLFTSPAFPTGPGGVTITEDTPHNFLLNGRCTGRIVINIPGGIAVRQNDFIRLEGVRGRIDMSLAQTPGTDLFVSLQSVNDPAANQFNPDRVRVAKSFDGMNVDIDALNLLLCFPTSGLVDPDAEQDASITISEGFGRAFVDDDATLNQRADDEGQPLGEPTVSTHFYISISGIPTSVEDIAWPDVVNVNEGTGAQLVLQDDDWSSSTGLGFAIYSFEAADQTNASDTRVESFTVVPTVELKSGQSATGTILAAVSLWPRAESAPSSCTEPGDDDQEEDQPRFMRMWETNADDVIQDDPPAPLYNIIRCNCYMLFTYVTANGAFDTGISIANTTGDEEVFTDDFDAPNQIGPVTFYFYDRTNGYVGSYTTTQTVGVGRSYVNVLSAILPGITPTPRTVFEGYVIARADFQFCHGFAFISDSRFATVAHGYIANIIPDPAIKFGGARTAADAGDPTAVPAGEGLNN